MAAPRDASWVLAQHRETTRLRIYGAEVEAAQPSLAALRAFRDALASGAAEEAEGERTRAMLDALTDSLAEMLAITRDQAEEVMLRSGGYGSPLMEDLLALHGVPAAAVATAIGEAAGSDPT